MEGDSYEITKSINGKENDWNHFEVLVEDIRKEDSCFRRIEFKTVRRTENQITHYLDRNARFILACDV